MSKEDDRSPLSKLSSSWLGRNLKLSVTALDVAASTGIGAIKRLAGNDESAKAAALEHDHATAQKIVESLGTMKGVAMKLGQMMSMDLALPEGWRRTLGALQDSTVWMEPDQIEAVVAKELGAPVSEKFSEWSREPIAAASIGQVHKAKLKDGTPVAVKVQYPEIRNVLAADFKNLGLLHAMGMMVRGFDSHGVIDEFRERLLEECDYGNEADAQQFFHRLYADSAEVHIPEVYPELSTSLVLTTRWAEGRRFRSFADHAPQVEKNEAGRILYDLAFTSIFRHRRFNCDPHPGNYLFPSFENGPRVTFLDFGCTKHFSDDVVEKWGRILRGFLEKDYERFNQAVIDIGIASKPQSFDWLGLRKTYKYLLRPVLTEGGFEFTNQYVSDSVKKLVAENSNRFHFNVPRDLLFANRLQWGLNSVLGQLGARFDARQVLLRVLYDDPAKHPPPYSEAEANDY